MNTLKDYKKLFRDFWGYSETDTPICWHCDKQQAVDIHHIIAKKMGAVKNNRLNRIDNLFPLCRDCHNQAHSRIIKIEDLQNILQEKIRIKENNDRYLFS